MDGTVLALFLISTFVGGLTSGVADLPQDSLSPVSGCTSSHTDANGDADCQLRHRQSDLLSLEITPRVFLEARTTLHLRRLAAAFSFGALFEGENHRSGDRVRDTSSAT